MTTVQTFDHSACDNAWKQVRCDRCGREYRCTPSSDFYCTPEGDHACEPCLVGGLPVTVLVPAEGSGVVGGTR